jgi:hypothetical protein
MVPTERMYFGGISEFAHGAIRLGGVEDQFSSKTNLLLD